MQTTVTEINFYCYTHVPGGGEGTVIARGHRRWLLSGKSAFDAYIPLQSSFGTSRIGASYGLYYTSACQGAFSYGTRRTKKNRKTTHRPCREGAAAGQRRNRVAVVGGRKNPVRTTLRVTSRVCRQTFVRVRRVYDDDERFGDEEIRTGTVFIVV
jgi:hypothetical protein